MKRDLGLKKGFGLGLGLNGNIGKSGSGIPPLTGESRTMGFRSNPQSTELAPAEAWYGKPLDNLVIFLQAASWAGLVSTTDTRIAENASANKRLMWAVGIAEDGSTMAQIAAGNYDSYWTQIFQKIAAADKHPEIMIRMWWEANLFPVTQYYKWCAKDVETDWIAAWRHVTTLAKAIDPRFKFCWVVNKTFGNPVFDPTTFYPGDAYVDGVGMDAYVVKSIDIDSGTLQGGVDFLYQADATHFGIDWLTAFAATHNKTLSFDESAIDSDNGEYFWSRIATTMRANKFTHIGMWDQNNPGQPDAQNKLSGGQYPATGAQFLREFGPLVAKTGTAYQAAANADTYIPLVCNRPVKSWSLVSGPAQCSIVGNALKVAAGLATGNVPVKVRANDFHGGETVDISITLTVVASLAIWTPALIASGDRAFWYDMAATGLITGTTDVSAFQDVWGLHNASQSTQANQATWSATARNNLPGLTFNGTSDYYALANPTTFPNSYDARSMTMAFFCPTVSGGFKNVFGVDDAAAGISYRLGAGGTPGTVRTFASEQLVTKIAADSKDLILSTSSPAVTAGAKQPQWIRVNGVDWFTHSITTSASTPAHAVLGARPSGTGAADYAAWVVKEFFGRKRATTELERVVDEGYMAWKWGGVADLPSDHPFKLGAPKAI